MPPPDFGEIAPPIPTRSIQIAFRLWLVAATISLIGDVYSFVERSAIPQLSTTSTVGRAVVQLVVLGVWVFVIFQMRDGKNWGAS